MITAAALCPSPPLLHPALTGRDAVLPELRAVCAQAAAWLLRDDPGEIVVVGPAVATCEWDAAGRLDPVAYAPGPGPLDPEVLAGAAARLRSLPMSLGLGAMLLDQAGYAGRRRLIAAGQDEPASACARLGASLGSASKAGRTALLVMGDGSARRSLKAPGYLDPRAATFDAEVERAVRAGDLGALLRIDQPLARDLMATGRPAWQVLAGAMQSVTIVSEVLYCGDPFGVAYLVACLRPLAPAHHRGSLNAAWLDGRVRVPQAGIRTSVTPTPPAPRPGYPRAAGNSSDATSVLLIQQQCHIAAV